VLDGDGGGLDGDAALALEVHGVEELLLGLAVGDGVGVLEQAVGEGGLAVVDVGDDGEVSDLQGWYPDGEKSPRARTDRAGRSSWVDGSRVAGGFRCGRGAFSVCGRWD
jgi:hypothetical protein